MPRLVIKGVSVESHDSVFSDSFAQCVWEVTFESKSGNVHAIEVAKAKSGSDCFSMLATLNSVNKVTDTDNIMTGTTIPISCNFRLQFDGEATGYMHEMKTTSFCIKPLSNPAVRLDSGADLRSIFDNLHDNGVSIKRRRRIVASLALVWVFNVSQQTGGYDS